MLRIKVFHILKELSKEELKKFGEYLNSPVFNKRKIIHDLFIIYKNLHPDFENPQHTKEKIFNKLFKGKKYNDEIFRNLNSLLLRHAEDFLSFINYYRNPLSIKKHLLSEINQKKILSIFEKHFEEAKNLLESTDQRDFYYFHDLYELYLQKDMYNTIINKFSIEDILKSGASFLTFFAIKTLEIQNYVLYQSKILGLEVFPFLREQFIESLIKKMPEEITNLPQIQIYYNALKLEQTGDEKYYKKLKLLLGRFGKLLGKDELYNKYNYMINYIKNTYSPKDLRTVSEMFHLRKEIIERNLLTENTIKNMFFLNIVKSGLKLGEHNWIFNFIDNYQPLLIPKYREITVNLSLALFYFEKKEFDKSLTYAAQIKYEDNFYNLQVKNLTARIYYETNDYESLVGSISSYRMYLSKNRTLSKAEVQSHNTFLNYLDKLLRIKEQRKFHKLKVIYNEISKTEFVNDIWFMNKVKELLSIKY